jgi:hypothetical protein
VETSTVKSSIDSWKQTKVIGRIWWCGDESCDCTQALIERITPNLNAGLPWIRRENLWSGRFYTDSGEKPWEDEGLPSPQDDLKSHLVEFGAITQEEYYKEVEPS